MSDPVTTSGRRAPKLQAFLASIGVCPSVTRAAKAAAEAAGTPDTWNSIRREHHKRYKADPVYAKAFDDAYAMGVQYLEDRCMEHAIEGFEQPVIWQGLVSYERDHDGNLIRDEAGRLKTLTIQKHSVELKKFMLQGAKPEKYRQNHHIDAHVTHSGITSLTDAELERIATGRDTGGGSGGAAPAPEQPQQDPDLLPE